MTDDRPTRRRVLATTGALLGATGLAGCLEGLRGQGDADPAGDGAATTVTVNGEASTATTTTEPTESTTDEATSADETATDDATTTDTTQDDATTTTAADRPAAVSFQAPHGTTIEATLYGEGGCGVVLVPQVNLDRESWDPQATRLADDGALVLAIDEDPDDRPSSVEGAITYLRETHGVSSVVLLGASSGGEAVVVANANAPAGAVDGTITLSAGGGEAYASRLQGRTLFVVSEDDEERFVEVATDLHEDAPDPTELVEYDGAAHGQRLFDSPHGDDLRARIRTFTRRVCDG